MFCKKPDPEKRKSRGIDRELKHDHEKRTAITQLLLLGTGESGKTTIIKQMKILHINGFNEEEKKEKIPFIRQNAHESIWTIVENMSKLEPPIELADDKNKISAEYIKNIGLKEPETYLQEYFDHVKNLWSDEGVKKAFNRSNEYQLIDSAEHFLNKIDELRRDDYVPTVEDILHCRIMTRSITAIEFQVPVSKMYGGGVAKFMMHDVGGQRGERGKWIQVFEGIQAMLFLIAASDFDLILREDETQTQNRLDESFALFSNMYWNRYLQDAGIIVFLNKQDLLKRKIESGKRVGDYFPEYKTYRVPKSEGNADDEYENSKMFMKKKILDVKKKEPSDHKLLESQRKKDRDIYIHFTTATDTKNIKLVFESVHEIILSKILSNVSIY